MSLPQAINPSQPQDSDLAVYGASELRNLKQLLVDLFGLPTSPTAIKTQFMYYDPNTNTYIIPTTRIGNTQTTVAGIIRWTGSDFEGYDGTKWVSLTSGQAPSSLLNLKTAFAYNMFFGGSINAY